VAPLTNTFIDSDATATVHAAHHDDVADVVNALTGHLFGTGEDGAVTLDPTVSGSLDANGTKAFDHSGTTTTFTLARDLNCTSLTIGATVTVVNTGGYRILCTGTVTIPAGCSVRCVGNNGVNGVGGNAAVALATVNSWHSTGVGAAGGGSAGAAGGASTNATGTMTIGGAGGGSGGAQAGGTSSLTYVNAQMRANYPRHPTSAMPLQWNGSAVGRFIVASGGGGGGSQATSVGGGGGGGAGAVIIYAETISNAGTISAAGGDGAAGSGSGAGGGGGGGGGGGLIVLCARVRTGAGTVTVAGGAGGAPQAAGIAGSAGTTGLLMELTV
jgi:hypothetical protein